MKKVTQSRSKNEHDERGMAAIMITMVIMTVITLLVLGFAITARREQRQSLDKQLNTQAFYAAETAVNDVQRIISANPTSTSLAKPNCANSGLYAGANGLQPNIGGGSSYSCVTVDPEPTLLTKTVITENDAWIVPIQLGSKPTSLDLKWAPLEQSVTQSSGATPASECSDVAYQFPKSTDRVCKYPVLRVDLVDLATLNTNDTQNLRSQMNYRSRTYYIQASPTVTSVSSGTSATQTQFQITYTGNDYDAGPPVAVVTSSCDGSGRTYGSCLIRFVQGPGAHMSGNMAMRVTSLYGSSSATLAALDNASNSMRFSGAQIMVDATGKAQDVLRRIQVRLPVQPPGDYAPIFAIQGSGSICKRYTTHSMGSGAFIVDSDIAPNLSNLAAGNIGKDLCQ